MKINFTEMNDDTKELYEYMWSNGNIPGGNDKLCRTYNKRYSTESKNSYSFEIPDGNGGILQNKDIVSKDRKINELNKELICNHLINIFKISQTEQFRDKFKEACSGSGGEAAKITTLHSSSLCALLFFYNVTKKNKLKIILNNETIYFYEVFFEYKNKVIAEPSNIDIVLIGEKSGGEHVVLFLESKFSEYLSVSSHYKDLRASYLTEFSKSFYNDSWLHDIGLEIIKDENQEPKVYKKLQHGNYQLFNGIRTLDKSQTYLEGLKQMISHYIGVSHFIMKDFYDGRTDFGGIDINQAEIFLGEIFFDFKFAEKQINDYSAFYKKLSGKLNLINPKIKVLPDMLKYSDLLDNVTLSLTNEIRNFYSH